MKKAVLVFAFAICFTYTLMAGNKEESNTSYGIKLGLDFITNSTESITGQLKSNYLLGAFVRIGNKLYFQPEAYYASYTTDQVNGNKFTYFKAPLLLGVRLLDLKIASLHIKGGPEYVKRLSSNYKGEFKWGLGIGADVLGFITTDIRYTFKNGDISSIAQIDNLIHKGGMVNLTLGIRF